MRHLAVLGSPIEHSLSPVLQSVAFAHLGLDYAYGRAEVASGGLRSFLDGLDGSWLGLSLTMPLKREVVPLLTTSSPLVEQLGVANTVVLNHERGETTLSGYNTDVDGIVRAVSRVGESRHSSCTILGGGATALSAIAAAAELGVEHVSLLLRDKSKATDAQRLASTLGLDLAVGQLSTAGDTTAHDFVVSALPGGVSVPDLVPSSPDAVLLDVAYDPWPSPLATSWVDAGAVAVSGLDMLVEQAIGQVRLFAGLPQTAPLPSEAAIRRAMRTAVGLPVGSGE